MTLSCLLVITSPCSQDWTSLSQCLQIDHTGSSSDDILRFIGRHGYMIVPPSNPPTQFYRKRPRGRRSTYTRQCPFTFEVKDFIDTIPRFLSIATCKGCDERCKPISYTLQLLRRKCKDYWLWEEQVVRVAYVLEL